MSENMLMASLGKTLLVIGAVLAGLGLLLLLADRVGWLGKLPGDIVVRREHFTFYFPLTTCLIISVIVSFVVWLFRR